jgi:predicted NUDIX family NTP pyrophosphohydrolase
MPKLSAGIALYRKRGESIEVLLVHPGGPFWAKKDIGAWSIPKGEYADDEDALVAAKREFKEETGFDAPASQAIELGEVKYGNKLVKAWAMKGSLDARRISSNTFTMEWPPKSGKKQEFDEVDRAGWFLPADAKQKLVRGQVLLVDRLCEQLGVSGDLGENPTQMTLL